jgi:hypothetical protein
VLVKFLNTVHKKAVQTPLWRSKNPAHGMCAQEADLELSGGAPLLNGRERSDVPTIQSDNSRARFHWWLALLSLLPVVASVAAVLAAFPSGEHMSLAFRALCAISQIMGWRCVLLYAALRPEWTGATALSLFVPCLLLPLSVYQGLADPNHRVACFLSERYDELIRAAAPARRAPVSGPRSVGSRWELGTSRPTKLAPQPRPLTVPNSVEALDATSWVSTPLRAHQSRFRQQTGLAHRIALILALEAVLLACAALLGPLVLLQCAARSHHTRARPPEPCRRAITRLVLTSPRACLDASQADTTCLPPRSLGSEGAHRGTLSL